MHVGVERQPPSRYAERLSTGVAVLGGGELLLPGEVALGGGETYTGPWLYGVVRRRARRGWPRASTRYLRRPPAPPARARGRSC